MNSIIVRPNRIAREIEGLLSGFFGTPVVPSNGLSDFAPRVDIREDDDQLTLVFEIPGMEKGDIKVTVADGVLSVSGERQVSREEKNGGFIRSEIKTGSFNRSFTLPDTVDTQEIAADYRKGLLTVGLKKKEEVKPRQIEVNIK